MKQRWQATIFYRTDAGLIDVDFFFDEIVDLHDAIENGPSFHVIDRVEIRLSNNDAPNLTIEGALAL